MFVYEPETQTHHILEFITSGTLLALLGASVKIIWSASALATTVETIKDNHLPHLDEKISGVKEDVKEIRQAFTEHLQNNQDYNVAVSVSRNPKNSQS